MSLEGMTVTVQRDVAAAPAQVWGLLTDVEAMPASGPSTWRPAGRARRAASGRRSPVATSSAATSGSCRARSRCYDEPRAFAWLVGDPAEPSALWSYEFAPYEGGTRVVQTFVHGPGFSYVRASVDRHPERAESVVAGRTAMLRANMTTVLVAAAARLTAGCV